MKRSAGRDGAAGGGDDEARSPLMDVIRAGARPGTGVALRTLDEDTVHWAVETGLGPLTYRATANDPDATASPFWPFLKGADLTARVLSTLQMDAMAEIIDVCRGKVAPLVLLKGISMCERHYAEPHLRPMRDLDFLVEEDAVATVESILARLGYVQRSEKPPAFYETHHHTAPFVHPETGIWVDVHRALVAPRSAFGSDTIFTAASVRTELASAQFMGRPVRRLRDELQLVHIACHWAHNLRVVGGMLAMADATYLLHAVTDVRWDHAIRALDGSAAARHVRLLLSYLARHRLIDLPHDVAAWLRIDQTYLDRATAALGHALLDRYVVGGQRFGALMSEPTFQRLWKLVVLRKRPARRFGVFVPSSRSAASVAGGDAACDRAPSTSFTTLREGVRK